MPDAHAKRLLVIGAHPDDAEFHAGGLMLKWVGAGHQLKILALTDGGAGHQRLAPRDLAAIRAQEALASAVLLGAELEIWNVADGTLQPSIELRAQLIADIRAFRPDAIVTHRPADYHPDHRASAQLVQDACYLLQVPSIAPDVAPLRAIPAVLLAADTFTYPRPFRADWVIDTTTCIPGIVELLHCHRSQVYEWLPFTQGVEVPATNQRAWLRSWYARRPAALAQKYAGKGVTHAEAFEVSEYGGRFDPGAYGLEGTQAVLSTDNKVQTHKEVIDTQ